jgi:hypothetical membrane protein
MRRQRNDRATPRWTMVSAGLAPVALIGGWTLAAARQPGGFDQRRGTISALAAHGAHDRWIMTAGLAGLGVCHVVTALGLRPVGRAGRGTLAVGGIGTALVAAFPQPAQGSSAAHTAAATVGFVALAAWPAVAALTQPVGTPRRVPLAASGLLFACVGWFFAELVRDGGDIGSSERLAAGAEAMWPLAVVVAGSLMWGRSHRRIQPEP